MHFHDSPPPSKGCGLRGCFVSMGMMSLAVIACLGSVFVVVDIGCHNDSARWLVDYPNAEFVTQEYSFIRAFGIGETTRILYSLDEVNTVRNWYHQHNTDLSTRGYSRGGRQANMRWNVTENPDGVGAIILLNTRCATQVIP